MEYNRMRELNVSEMKEVNGGEGETASEAVRKNAQTANDTCGKGNVKSVTKDGFECK
jgi:hypothetical protein